MLRRADPPRGPAPAAGVGLQEGVLDDRRLTTIPRVVLASAAVPMRLPRDIPAELDG